MFNHSFVVLCGVVSLGGLGDAFPGSDQPGTLHYLSTTHKQERKTEIERERARDRGRDIQTERQREHDRQRETDRNRKSQRRIM